MEGTAGAFFCISWSQVSEDSDGPLEWCRPVPDDRARELAGEYPELTRRTVPAHHEAFVHLGYGAEVAPAQWQLVSSRCTPGARSKPPGRVTSACGSPTS